MKEIKEIKNSSKKNKMTQEKKTQPKKATAKKEPLIDTTPKKVSKDAPKSTDEPSSTGEEVVKYTKQSSFFMFLSDNREDIQKKNPGIKVTEITKIAGDLWKKLPENKKDVYRKKSAESDPIPVKKKHKKTERKTTNNGLKAFTKFKKEEKEKFIKEGGVDLGKLLSEKWKQLSLEEKNKYRDE